jgi:hypothetical protein
MLISMTAAEARAQNRVQRVEEASATDLIGRRGVNSADPIAFLVECRPDFIIPPHFHDTPQFQIFVGGGSRMGKHASDPVSMHYVDAATPYGPIVGDEKGYAFLTLRQHSATGYHVMPGSRHLMTGRPGRTRMAGPLIRPATDQPLARTLFCEPDGAAALEVCAPPGSVLPSCADIRHGGAFYVVVGGAVETQGGRYTDADSACFWIDADEPPAALTAGPDGAWVLFLSFSRDS